MVKYLDYDIVFQEIPDEVTLAINISNCPNRCTGCHSPHLMEDVGFALTPNSLYSLLEKYKSAITCVCFMGGDADPGEIASLASFIHLKSNRLSVGWYSGRTKLPVGFPLSIFDYIKLGPYIKDLGGLRSKTTNQRLYKVINGEKLEEMSIRDS